MTIHNKAEKTEGLRQKAGRVVITEMRRGLRGKGRFWAWRRPPSPGSLLVGGT